MPAQPRADRGARSEATCQPRSARVMSDRVMARRLVIGVGSLAQAFRLARVCGGCTGWLRPPFRYGAILGQRFCQRLAVPGVARDNPGGVECCAGSRIAGEQKCAAAIESRQGAERPRRMAGQRQEHDPAVGKEVALARDFVDRHWLIPIGGEIAGRLAAGRAGSGEFIAVNEKTCLAEKRIAAAMVGMQVRIDHHVDVVGKKVRLRQVRRARGHPAASIGVINLAELAERRSGSSATAGWQPVSNSTLPWLCRNSALDTGSVDGFAHARATAGKCSCACAQPTARQKMHFHGLCLNLRRRHPKNGCSIAAAHTMQ